MIYLSGNDFKKLVDENLTAATFVAALQYNKIRWFKYRRIGIIEKAIRQFPKTIYNFDMIILCGNTYHESGNQYIIIYYPDLDSLVNMVKQYNLLKAFI